MYISFLDVVFWAIAIFILWATLKYFNNKEAEKDYQMIREIFESRVKRAIEHFKEDSISESRYQREIESIVKNYNLGINNVRAKYSNKKCEFINLIDALKKEVAKIEQTENL